jgi:hypothetical protein
MKKFLFWFLAFIIAAGTMLYQRLTGPTYPYNGKVEIDATLVKFELPRSSVNTSDCEVAVDVPDSDISGFLEYKRYKTEDAWTKVPLERKDNMLIASFPPKQPMAGKLAYRVILAKGEKSVSLSGENPIVIRFRGDVPIYVLIPHVLIMLLALLFSTRAGLAALDKKSDPGKYAKWAAVLFFITGFILGPLMQYYGFGLLWSGFPLGHDLTDNKALVAMVGWLIALFMMRRGKPARGWVLAASILLLVVFLIPHSLLGSELDYSKMAPPARINLP